MPVLPSGAMQRGNGDLPQTSDRHDSTAFRIQGAIEEGVELLTLNAPVKINADAEGNVYGFVAQPQIISVYDNRESLP